jgi:hypothetical protein
MIFEYFFLINLHFGRTAGNKISCQEGNSPDYNLKFLNIYFK